MQNQLLPNLVGAPVRNHEGDFLGQVTEVTKNAEGTAALYAIIKSEVCFGQGDRFFAVPASARLFDVTNKGKIILQLSKDDLQFAKGIEANKLPSPQSKYDPAVFELFKYKAPID